MEVLRGNIMELNDVVTDGFMRTADMRSDIIIVQKPQERARDYDQIGTVRVAKFLQMPRLDLWKGNSTVQTRKEDNIWYVAVNDQELAQTVARSGNGEGNFSERYVDAFRQEVVKGMKDVLKREKLLNGGEYNLAFLTSYFELFTKVLLVLPIAELEVLLHSSSPAEVAQGTAKVVGLYVIVSAASNAFNLFSVFWGNLGEKIGLERQKKDGIRLQCPKYEDPFIRHSIPEYIMPPVPLDRLARGMKYLGDHEGELIINLEKTDTYSDNK